MSICAASGADRSIGERRPARDTVDLCASSGYPQTFSAAAADNPDLFKCRAGGAEIN